MKQIVMLMLSAVVSLIVVSSFADEAEKPAWTCSLKVENPKQQSKVVKDRDTGSRQTRNNRWNNRTTEKSIARSLVVPVKVSVGGKDAPTSGFSIKTTFVGSRDGENVIIGETTTPVKLENNVFKTEVKSPTATLTKTMRTRGRHTESDSSGERITGTIVQLFYEGKVVRSWSSRPAWAKLAKEPTLNTEALLK